MNIESYTSENKVSLLKVINGTFQGSAVEQKLFYDLLHDGSVYASTPWADMDENRQLLDQTTESMIKTCIEIPLDELPLYINHPYLIVNIILSWRLEVGI